MANILATLTINKLNCLFNRYSFSKILVFDNETQFTLRSFKIFCERYGIIYIKSASYHPQSNGQAERFVDTFKRTVKINSNLGHAILEFLRTYRPTPSQVLNGKTPSEFFLGKNIRTEIALVKKIVFLIIKKKLNTHPYILKCLKTLIVTMVCEIEILILGRKFILAR